MTLAFYLIFLRKLIYSFTDIITSCKINPGYRSDHSILELNVKINMFQRGKGLWKFNCSLLKNENYIDMINKAIKDTKLQYAVPIYTYEYLNADNDWDMQFTIDDNLLLEMLLLKTRLGQLGANISPDRSSLTPQVLIGNF